MIRFVSFRLHSVEKPREEKNETDEDELNLNQSTAAPIASNSSNPYVPSKPSAPVDDRDIDPATRRASRQRAAERCERRMAEQIQRAEEESKAYEAKRRQLEEAQRLEEETRRRAQAARERRAALKPTMSRRT